MAVRLLLVSDIHGNLSAVRRLSSVERDVTIVAGDLADCGGSVNESLTVIEELASQGPPVVWVPGNCDSPSILEAKPPNGSFLVHGRCARVEDICFAGAGGGTFSPFSTPFEMSDEELGSVIGKALESVQEPTVLVTHVPGYGTGLDVTFSGMSVGSRSVRRAVEARRLLLHVCGHIHEAWGVTVIGQTVSVNPGPLFEGRYAAALINTERMVSVVRLYKF